MAKRSSGEGTIVRRKDGLWTGAITLASGKRKWVYAKTQSEVARKLAALRRDRDTGLPITTERRSVESYMNSWLEMIRPAVKPNTFRSYEYVTRVHIIPSLGRMQLAKLTPETVQRWLAAKQQETSGKTGKPLSITTVRYLHTVTTMALGEAVKLGVVPRNVAAGLRKPRRRRIEMKWWTREQARAVLDAAKQMPAEHQASRFYALFALDLSTGLRESELFGLRWRDLDLAKRQLRVQTQLQWKKTPHGDIPSFDELKTDTGRRQIKLAPPVAQALRAHRARQQEERLKLGPIWRENDLVFCNSIGGGLLLSNFRRNVYLPIVRAAGVPYIRPHDMRHSAATLAILDGMPIKAVSEMLGHSSVTVTMAIYAHVLPESHERVADAMARLLFDEPLDDPNEDQNTRSN